MKKILMGLCGITMLLWSLGCAKLDTEFRDFLADNEIIYTGAVGKVINRPGNLRTELKWRVSSDPTIVKYVIYWNGKSDSVVVNAEGQTDSITALITGLEEYSYAFTIHSFDAKGNRSIPTEVNNVKVYGNVYANGLLNRAYNVDNSYLYDYDNHTVTLNFLPTDTLDGFNVGTIVRYQTNEGETVEKELSQHENSIVLPNFKHGTEITYRSSYIPERNALDTFTVANYDTYAAIYALFECNKDLFAEVKLPFDVAIYNGDECPVRKLWDRSVGPQGYPNIFHSADGSKMPQAITFDLGKVYTNLAVLEETGRNCCGNPVRFEVWGIDDITNAAPTVDPSDAAWVQQSLDKGWTLLRDVIRTDNGSAAMRFDLMENPPAVRYIRIRIKQVDGGGNTSNMSELTFWNKE